MSATKKPASNFEGPRPLTSRRKPGRPFKERSREAPEKNPSASDAREPGHEAPPLLIPPSIPFRSFKAALSGFKDRGIVPSRLDHSIWTNQLFGTDLHDTVDAYRFLGLINHDAKPQAAFEALFRALGGDSWPAELRRVLEDAYAPLLASSVSDLTPGGLLRSFRAIYRTRGEATRRCCSFFVHAAREAALDIGPFLTTNSRSRWVHGRRLKRWETPSETANADDDPATQSDNASLNSLISKFPAYEETWPDDIKRLWFDSYRELMQRLDD